MCLTEFFRGHSRELLASRAFWLLLLFVGFLVGHSFTTAVGLYAEMSGSANGGGPASRCASNWLPVNSISARAFSST